MRRRLIPVLAASLALLGAAPAAGDSHQSRSFTIAATGDVLIHQAIATAAAGHALLPGHYDFRPLFRPIEPWISDADLAICHLEGTLSPTNTGLLYQNADEHPAYFNAPREVADALAATGYDACSTAGNHALDRGLTGVQETLAVLDAAGLGHAGTARDAQERLPAFYHVKGVRVAHLAYTIGTNEPRPADARWAVNIIDAAAILDDARSARANGAEFTILSLHWGTQYQVAPDGRQVSLAEVLTASPDIDLILGHHAHVVQPIARVNEKVVVYGMGDHLSNIRTMPDGTKYGAEDGVIAHLSVVERSGGGFSVTEIAVTPTWVDPATKQVLPIDHVLAEGTTPATTATLRASRALTRQRLALLGEEIPLTPTPWPSLTCAGRAATVIGTAADDLLLGTPGGDIIVGRGGDDVIIGGAGNDLICGGAGNDLIWGGPGNDLIWGRPGNDTLSGGQGHDRLWGDHGDDRLAGGEGDDTLTGGEGNDTLTGGGGNDLLIAGHGINQLWGGTGHNTLITPTTPNHPPNPPRGGPRQAPQPGGLFKD